MDLYFQLFDPSHDIRFGALPYSMHSLDDCLPFHTQPLTFFDDAVMGSFHTMIGHLGGHLFGTGFNRLCLALVVFRQFEDCFIQLSIFAVKESTSSCRLSAIASGPAEISEKSCISPIELSNLAGLLLVLLGSFIKFCLHSVDLVADFLALLILASSSRFKFSIVVSEDFTSVSRSSRVNFLPSSTPCNFSATSDYSCFGFNSPKCLSSSATLAALSSLLLVSSSRCLSFSDRFKSASSFRIFDFNVALTSSALVAVVW